MLMKQPPLKIVIIRLSALGDIVNTAVTLQIIHTAYPNAHIDWIVEEAFAPILDGHPQLHSVIPVPIKKIKKEKNFSLLYATIQKLRSLDQYDYIIDTQGLLKSAIVTYFLKGHKHGFDAASARERAAAWFYTTTSSIPYEQNVITRNVQIIAEALHIPFSLEQIKNKHPIFPLQSRPEFLRDKTITCVIGASWPSKCYPKEHFSVICSAMPYPCLLIWGSETERLDAEWIATHSSNAFLAPKMTLRELINCIGHCDLTIGNDTGPTHMAWAMNRPSITLFGPTTERMIFSTPTNIAIKSPSKVNILKIDRHDFSIREISPSLVIQNAKELL